MSKNHSYALGSKKGPVMVDGTVYESQDEYNNLFSLSLVIVGILLAFLGAGWLSILGWIMVIFGGFTSLALMNNKK